MVVTTQDSTLTFNATLYTLDKWTVGRVPDDISEKLSSRGQVAVEGTINGQAVQTVLEPDGRSGHWFKVDQRLQKLAHVSAGDAVILEITQTKNWPEPHIPEDFSNTLATAPSAVQALWVKITPMARWEWIRWINATSNPETRERRVEVSISKLQSGKRRPCCFNLSACTDPDLAKNGKLIDKAVKPTI
jgi:uncharacterized protein YdeI (YjbR/CyaY-like superfamily)